MQREYVRSRRTSDRAAVVGPSIVLLCDRRFVVATRRVVRRVRATFGGGGGAVVPATQATYLVDGAGSVTLDVSDNVLTIVSVRHGVGWTVVTATNSDATTVVV
ncbi:MAG: hypothetical protein WCK21_07385, partial [Actinomycetota bacterium]